MPLVHTEIVVLTTIYGCSVETHLDPIYDSSRLDRELVEGSHASKARLTAYLRVLPALARGRQELVFHFTKVQARGTVKP